MTPIPWPPRAYNRPPDYEETLCALMSASGGACGICGYLMDHESRSGPMRPTIEHVIPGALGGRETGNRVAAHQECNRVKADRIPRGCELVFLMAVNARLGVEPMRW